MLPFLKDRNEGSISGPVGVIKREPDEGAEDFGMLDAIAHDMMDAFHSKDTKLLKDALQAFKEHLQEEDQAQDLDELK